MNLKSIINRMTVGQKVMTVIFVEIVSYTIITTIAISQISSLGSEMKRMSDLYLPLFSATESIRQHIQDMRLSLKEIIFIGDRVVYDKDTEAKYVKERARYTLKVIQISNELNNAEEMIEQSIFADADKASAIHEYGTDLLPQLDRIRQASKIYNGKVDELFLHIEFGSYLMGMETIGEASNYEKELNSQLDRLLVILFSLKQASVDLAAEVENRAYYFTIMASLLTICIVIVIFFFVVKRNITKPFYVLIDTINSFDQTRPVAESAREKAIMAKGDELGTVAKSFNNLKYVLWDQRKAMERAKEEAERAKEEAERANRAKSKFLAAASHDLRQPMHAMQMFIAALRERVKDDEALHILSNIDAVSVSSGRLLNALLDVSQLEAGDIQPQYENFPVQEVLRRVARSFVALAQRKGLECRVIPSSLVVNSDPILLERIVQNLVSNAIRYTTSGKVLIGCRLRGDKVSIEVWDTGPGIPDDQSEAIYEEFHQLNNEERDRGRGLGLGLAIVRRLAACLNHQVEHISELGKGSCFSIFVDLAHDAQGAAPMEIGALAATGELTGTKVLVVEDDVMVLDGTCKLLNTWGLETIAASSTEDAVRVVSNSEVKPNFIIADFRLPGNSDGVDAITKVQLLIGEPVPSLLITGDIETGRHTTMSELGYRILKKPVRPAKLRSLMTHLVIQQRKSAQTRESAGYPDDLPPIEMALD